MTLHLMNSAMMPVDGTYKKQSITPDEARAVFQKYARDWKSYIGYPNAARVLSELFEVSVPIGMDKTDLRQGDIMLVATLRYRVPPAEKKGRPARQHGETLADYEFALVAFAPETA